MDNSTRAEKPAYFYGTGRRKSAVARVRLYPGNGQIIINSKSPEDYFDDNLTIARLSSTASLRKTTLAQGISIAR